jgi:RHS repeat-associated protein
VIPHKKQLFRGRRRIVKSWHRFYDPTTGRYISADPSGLVGGINLYGYAFANPVNLVDPLGLEVPLPGDSDFGTRQNGSGSFFISGGLGATGRLHFFMSGISVHYGTKLIVTDCETILCIYETKCLRIGPGFFAGAGFEGSLGVGSKFGEGWSIGAGGDAAFGGGGGLGGSVNSGGIEGVGAWGGYGIGLTAGLDVCDTRLLYCETLFSY